MSSAAAVPRIAPIEPPYDPDTAAQLARWMPGGSDRDSSVEPLALFRTLARHEGLMARMRPLGAHILGSHSSLPLRVREIVIDRTCALAGSEYEWGVHAAAFAGAAGLDEEQIASTARGRHTDPCWEAEGAAAMRLAEELHETSTISDRHWEELSALFDERQIIELVVTAGWYHVIAYLCNGLGVPLEEWALRFPG